MRESAAAGAGNPAKEASTPEQTPPAATSADPAQPPEVAATPPAPASDEGDQSAPPAAPTENPETPPAPPAAPTDDPAADAAKSPEVADDAQQDHEESVDETVQVSGPNLHEDGLHAVLSSMVKNLEAEGDHAAHAALHVIETVIGELRHKCTEGEKVLKGEVLRLVQMLKESL